MSILSQWEMRLFPEFPPPDSHESRNRRSKEEADPTDLSPHASTMSMSSSPTKTPSREPDNSPSVSCYIPSIPGMRFFLQWKIEPPHPEGQLFYFKLFINGRHISSWGTDPQKNPRGWADRAFFGEEGQGDKTENGRTTFGSPGIEARPFLFTPLSKSGSKTAADDGGLIEVRAFRAKAKKRMAPVLEQFRPQEQYGISLPKTGLLDKPQDARYYDWILVDRKDQPYATFFFHYRSWESLQSLQLIPASYRRTLLKPSNSFVFLDGPAASRCAEPESSADCDDDDEEDNLTVYFKPSPPKGGKAGILRYSAVSESTISRSNSVTACDRPPVANCKPSGQMQNRTGMAASHSSMPPNTVKNWFSDRPLPELPTASSSNHSRETSSSSNAPSITPSLLQWCDREPRSSSPEPIIAVATAVSLVRSSATEVNIHKRRSPRSPSVARPDVHSQSSPSPAPKSKANALSIPPEAIFLPSDASLEAEWKPIPSMSARRRLFVDDQNFDVTEGVSPFVSISPTLSESEWLSSKPFVSIPRRYSEPIGMATLYTRYDNITFADYGKTLNLDPITEDDASVFGIVDVQDTKEHTETHKETHKETDKETDKETHTEANTEANTETHKETHKETYEETLAENLLGEKVSKSKQKETEETTSDGVHVEDHAPEEEV